MVSLWNCWSSEDWIQEILGVGRKEVYRLIAAGALPAVRAGRGYRILKAALVEWLAGGKAA